MKYKMTSGFETHVELKTNTKIFCSCKAQFGAEPNTCCCPVCVGLPGAMPGLNKRVVEFAVRAGLALNCKINNISYMDRKNYFYPDLPKAYQITQYDVPVCENGYVELRSGKKIGITRIQIEEDAGKLVHKDKEILIDYNRAGVPLIEIVSEPHIESTQEAVEFAEKLRLIMRYIGVSDCKMQEGSMRCDVNISVSKDNTLGNRTEIKNMNSIANIKKAMEYEYKRQVEILENGGKITQETLGYDEKSGSTYSMRSKEDATDYRFFREPDLLPIHISDEDVDEIRKSLPELPEIKLERYVDTLNLEKNDAELLVKYPNVAEFFEETANGLNNPKTAANLILGVIFAFLRTENDKEDFKLKITPEKLRRLIVLTEENKINISKAKSVLEEMLASGKEALEVLTPEDLKGFDDKALANLCQKAIDENEKIAGDYKNGKVKAIMALVGFVMRESKGRANPEKVKAELIKLIK